MFILMTLAILLLLLLLLIAVIIITPIRLSIDTVHDEFVLQVTGLALCKLYLVEGSVWVSIRVPFYHMEFDLLERIFTDTKTTQLKEKKIKGKPKSGGLANRFRGRLRRILMTFQLKKLYLNIDFGNNLLTGMLYPAFFLAEQNGFDVHSNFIGKKDFVLVLENRLYRVGKALFF